MAIILLFLYCSLLTFILLYSINQLHLVWLYLKRPKEVNQNLALDNTYNLPVVTIQLPIYNEKYVISRLIDAVINFDYPKDKLEIQVLDDSTDETVELVANKVDELRKQGFQIKQIIRTERTGFKAGALKYGLNEAKGEFVAIFDADFVPDADFLQKTLPYFRDKKVGVVQTRWGHLNENYSILTKLQSYALNAHFIIEQGGRNAAGHFINFNGTAGIWRKTTIEDAGGWEADTLTEDLDLSYRAQLKGWKFKYLENKISPAELPAEMNAIKSQQFRWSKGAAECVRKSLKMVLTDKSLKFSSKVHAFFHLMNSFNYISLLLSGMLLIPLMFLFNELQGYDFLLGFMSIYHVSFFLLFAFYFTANKGVNLNSWSDYIKFMIHYPFFLSISMGISLYNAIGVIEGYLGKKSPFVRTPKFNLVKKKGNWGGKDYVKRQFTFVTWLEISCFILFGFGLFSAIKLQNFGAIPYFIMMTVGFGSVLYYSFWHQESRKPEQTEVQKLVLENSQILEAKHL